MNNHLSRQTRLDPVDAYTAVLDRIVRYAKRVLERRSVRGIIEGDAVLMEMIADLVPPREALRRQYERVPQPRRSDASTELAAYCVLRDPGYSGAAGGVHNVEIEGYPGLGRASGRVDEIIRDALAEGYVCAEKLTYPGGASAFTLVNGERHLTIWLYRNRCAICLCAPFPSPEMSVERGIVCSSGTCGRPASVRAAASVH